MESDLAELTAGYQIPARVRQLVETTPIVLLVGVSGAGKDTIKQRLLQTGRYHHIVSHTTRAPRYNGSVLEKDGLDYHFIDHGQAAEMLAAEAFVEAKVYSGNLYATSAAELEAARHEQRIAITDLEVQGVAEYRAISDKVACFFILPPNYSEWQHRLINRYGADKPDAADLAKRMKAAGREIQEALNQPYYHFIVNEDLDTAVEAIDKLAGRPDGFSTVDRSFRVWAEQLLAELQQNS